MSSHRSDLLDLEVVLLHETEAAIKVTSLDTGAEDVWLPKSRVEFTNQKHYHGARMIDLTIPRSLAEEKGLA